jgi:hypothetical protein
MQDAHDSPSRLLFALRPSRFLSLPCFGEAVALAYRSIGARFSLLGVMIDYFHAPAAFHADDRDGEVLRVIPANEVEQIAFRFVALLFAIHDAHFPMFEGSARRTLARWRAGWLSGGAYCGRRFSTMLRNLSLIII